MDQRTSSKLKPSVDLFLLTSVQCHHFMFEVRKTTSFEEDPNYQMIWSVRQKTEITEIG